MHAQSLFQRRAGVAVGAARVALRAHQAIIVTVPSSSSSVLSVSPAAAIHCYANAAPSTRYSVGSSIGPFNDVSALAASSLLASDSTNVVGSSSSAGGGGARLPSSSSTSSSSSVSPSSVACFGRFPGVAARGRTHAVVSYQGGARHFSSSAPSFGGADTQQKRESGDGRDEAKAAPSEKGNDKRAGEDLGGEEEKGGSASAPPRPSFMYKLTEDVKDIFAVAFGLERQRDVEAEYDMGIREYPWVCYEDPASPGKMIYRNNRTGLVTELKPADFDQRAKPSARLILNTTTADVSVLPEGADKTAWERRLDSLAANPLVQGAAAAGRVVAASPVGEAVGGVAAKVRSATEGIAERWDTSQHP
jgi:hypothetical protein